MLIFTNAKMLKCQHFYWAFAYRMNQKVSLTFFTFMVLIILNLRYINKQHYIIKICTVIMLSIPVAHFSTNCWETDKGLLFGSRRTARNNISITDKMTKYCAIMVSWWRHVTSWWQRTCADVIPSASSSRSLNPSTWYDISASSFSAYVQHSIIHISIKWSISGWH